MATPGSRNGASRSLTKSESSSVCSAAEMAFEDDLSFALRHQAQEAVDLPGLRENLLGVWWSHRRNGPAFGPGPGLAAAYEPKQQERGASDSGGRCRGVGHNRTYALRDPEVLNGRHEVGRYNRSPP